jgi:lipid A oxidase
LTRPARATAAVLAGALLCAPAARAETELAVYLGWAFAAPSDLRLAEAGGEAVTYHGVSWRTRSLTNPIYYGVRLTRWLAAHPDAGLALDFTHAKVYLEDTAVRVTGSRGGTPVDGVERISDTIRSFNNSHGLNLVTVNALRRWSGAGDDSWRRKRLSPYVGVGAGLAWPHVEADIGGRATYRYQLAGPVVGALAGLSVRAARHWSLFGEYRLDRAWLDESLAGGRNVTARVDVQQVTGGVARRF